MGSYNSLLLKIVLPIHIDAPVIETIWGKLLLAGVEHHLDVHCVEYIFIEDDSMHPPVFRDEHIVADTSK